MELREGARLGIPGTMARSPESLRTAIYTDAHDGTDCADTITGLVREFAAAHVPCLARTLNVGPKPASEL